MHTLIIFYKTSKIRFQRRHVSKLLHLMIKGKLQNWILQGEESKLGRFNKSDLTNNTAKKQPENIYCLVLFSKREKNS